MKRFLIILFAASVSAPALAQHTEHAAPPSPPAAAPPPPNPHAGHNMPAAPAQSVPPPAANPHAGHSMPAAPAAPQVADPHAGHNMSAAPAATPPAGDPHAGHNMPQAGAVDPMEGHGMSNMGEAPPDPPVAPPPSAALGGPAHAADTVFPMDRMVDARGILRTEHGSIRTHLVLIDLLETRIQSGRDGYAWDAQAWYGGATNRLWLKTEGEGAFGQDPEQAEVQVLWSRAIDPWFNLQAGVRYDFRPDPGRGYLVLGIEGLAPYWFEVDGALFLSEKGDLSARFEGEYEQRITQRLILQPRIDLDFSLQDVPELRIGSGLSSAEAGLRLRYEVVPEFAPYCGVHYGRAFGDTARFRRASGEDVGGWSFLVGVRTWF